MSVDYYYDWHVRAGDNLTNRNVNTFRWPKELDNTDKVGVITAALVGDVTELIVGGAEVVDSLGAAWDGRGTKNGDDFDESVDFL